ncbi:MAG: trimethylamine methyltransferase family protein, partial [Verrucomicrobia bacterium]|nr:trimethylamine methyltransferase family protein [Verrucomicrobiota bacterium]
MKTIHGIQQLTAGEKERIHRAVLRILAEIGVKVESNRILDRLGDFGADVNRPTQIARFPQALIEQFIGESEPVAERVAEPRVECSVGIYIGKYLNPRANQFE